MLSIKRFLKAIRVINDKDQTKSLELSVSDLASTQTKTVLQSIQTADHTLTLPDVTGIMIANVNNNANISGVTINLTNTTQNKLLLAGPSTGNSLIQDSEFTQSTSATDVAINVTKTLTLSSPSKEIIMDGKALRIPVLTFPIITPPTGNAGDILFNTITQSLWICDNSGTYIEQVSATGTNRTLSNLLAPTAINQSLLPDTNNTRNLGSSSLNFNEGHITTVVATNVNTTNATVSGPLVVNGGTVLNGNLTVNGTLTTLNTTTTNVVDPNVTLNFGGTDSTAQGAGLTIARTGTNGSLVYDSGLASKFKIGDQGFETEIITQGGTQLIIGDKVFNGVFGLGTSNMGSTGSNATIGASRSLLLNNSATLVSVARIAYLPSISHVSGTIVNTQSTNLILKHQAFGGTSDGEIFVPGGADYVLIPGQSISFKLFAQSILRTVYIEGKVDKSRIGTMEQSAVNLDKLPEGYLFCDGREVSQATYADLYAKIGNNFAKNNQPVTSGKFVLPDMRGQIAKGATDYYSVSGSIFGGSLPTTIPSTSGVGWDRVKTGDRVFKADAGGGVASRHYYINVTANLGQFSLYITQSDAYASAGGAISFSSAGSTTLNFSGDRDITSRYKTLSGTSIVNTTTTNYVGSTQENQFSAHSHTYLRKDQGPFLSGAGESHLQVESTNSTGITGGSETRPDNIFVTYIIKALPDYI